MLRFPKSAKGQQDDDLISITELTSLERFEAHGTYIPDEGLSSLSGLVNLKQLALVACWVSGSGFDHLKKLTALEGLNLAACPNLGDPGVAQLPPLPKLNYLGLSFTIVTDAALEYLGGLKTLRRVELGKTKVTSDGVKKLRKQLPNCEVFADQ